MFTWRATIRQFGCHDFVAEIKANDQIQAKSIFESMYGKGSILGDCVYRV